MKKYIKSIDDLKTFAKELIDKWYKKILLNWELWAGKTELTKQLCFFLNIKNISSPTYTYINIYDDKLLHWDFYRIETEQEFISLWLLDEIENYEYVIIEWPKFKELYKDDDFIEINIKKIDESNREIEIIK